MRSARDWQLWLAHLATYGRSIGAALADLDAGRPVDHDELDSALALAAGDRTTAEQAIRSRIRTAQVPS